MNFEKSDLLLSTLTRKGITDGMFNNFDITKFEEYRDMFRNMIADYKEEIISNLRQPYTEQDIVSMIYNKIIFSKQIKYFKAELKRLDSEYKKFINEENIHHYEKFQNEKIRVTEKAASFATDAISALMEGVKTFKEIEKKSALEAIFEKIEKEKPKSFQWAQEIELRELFYNELKEKQFIHNDTNYQDFKNAFFSLKDRTHGDINPLGIKWIDKGRNGKYSSKSLIYFLKELVREGFIEKTQTSTQRNDIIRVFFSDDNGKQIKKLPPVESKPENAKIIKAIIEGLKSNTRYLR